MRILESLRSKMLGLGDTVTRYPLTLLFLVALAAVNAISIQDGSDEHSRYVSTFVIGAMLAAVAQQMYERFFAQEAARYIGMAAALIVTAGYWFTIAPGDFFHVETSIKTGVILFALLMAFIWVPSINSRLTFNDSFLAAFKAFFTTVLFSAVISGGLSLVLLAVDQLLFSIGDTTIGHVMNVVGSLFAPLFFLSLMPDYQHADSRRVEKATSFPYLLEILVSYIIIPLTALYTLILLAYMAMNIRGDFWTDNLLEPMLVSYAVAVILVYVLASRLENQFALLFRRIFPKVLIPIVVFQVIASMLKIQETGITHGRYYVIMFGVFAAISGVIFSFYPVRKNGWIAAVLIIFSAVSILPPVDAFSVSRNSQTQLLEKTLSKNDMLQDGKVQPNADISKEDKKKIAKTVDYLAGLDYTKKISWLPDNADNSHVFEDTFGFAKIYEHPAGPHDPPRFASLQWEGSEPLSVEGYDLMLYMNVLGQDQQSTFTYKGETYSLEGIREDGVIRIVIKDENGSELISVDTKDFLEKTTEADPEGDVTTDHELSAREASLTEENDKAKVLLLFNTIDMYEGNFNADLHMFIKLK